MTKRLSRHIGLFILDRRVALLLVVLGLIVGARSWLAAHPQHDPWAPLDLNDPVGWATQAKLAALRDDTQMCRSVLQRSDIAFQTSVEIGKGPCRRSDRTQLDAYPFAPSRPETTCQVAVALTLWRRDVLDPAAQQLFGATVREVRHLGAYSCRRLYGRDDGPWSEHATANAIDIAGFVLADGTQISVLDDWNGEDSKAQFLREVRDGACQSFTTVLSPEYNAAHADHFHLDMGARRLGVCR